MLFAFLGLGFGEIIVLGLLCGGFLVIVGLIVVLILVAGRQRRPGRDESRLPDDDRDRK